MKTMNEIFEMSDKEFWDYESDLFIHAHLVREEGKIRMKKEVESDVHQSKT